MEPCHSHLKINFKESLKSADNKKEYMQQEKNKTKQKQTRTLIPPKKENEVFLGEWALLILSALLPTTELCNKPATVFALPNYP